MSCPRNAARLLPFPRLMPVRKGPGTPLRWLLHMKIRVMGGTRNARSRDSQLGPSCDDVLDRPTEGKDSSDRHSQRDDHDWKHDKD